MDEHPPRTSLGATLVGLADDGDSGVLLVRGSSGQEKGFRFGQGDLRDIAVPGKERLPERAVTGLLLASGREKLLRRARRLVQKLGCPLDEAVLRLEEVPEEEIAGALRAAIVDELAEALSWEDPRIEVASEARGFRGELGDRFDLSLRLDELYLDAMRRLRCWEPLAEILPELREIYYATPSAGRYISSTDAYPAQVAVLNQVDGNRLAREVIADSGLDPFEAFATLRALVAEGDLAPRSPVELFQLGDAVQASDPARGLAILERARERGLDDFDIQWRLANLYETLGDPARALARYREFAGKCTAQFRLEDTIRALEKVISLDPDDLDARERLVDLLVKAEREDEADRGALEFARLCAERGDPARAGRLVARRLEEGRRTAELLEAAAGLADAAGDAEGARARREELARIHLEAGAVEMALEIYQRLFCEGHDGLEVRRRLIDLHLQVGEPAKAEEHLESLIDGPPGVRADDPDVLRELHRKVCEIHPGHPRSTWYLVEDAAARDEPREAADLLRDHVSRLGETGDVSDRIRALERIVACDPEDLDAHWDLAMALEEAGRDEGAIEALRRAARQAAHAGDPERAERALRRVLRAHPFDLAAREELVWVAVEREDGAAAAARARDLVRLRLLAGEREAAAAAGERLGDDPADAFILVQLAEGFAGDDDARRAADLLARAEEIFRATDNPGLARRCGERLREIDPSRPASQAPVGSGETAGAGASAGPSGPAAAPCHDPGAGGAPAVRTTSLGSITARLRSLKSGGREPPCLSGSGPAASGASPQCGPLPDAGRPLGRQPEVRKAKLHGPAARLSMLRKEKELST